MRPSHISYAFLGSFLVTIFLLQWWQEPAYPWWIFIILGSIGFFGSLGFRSAIPIAIVIGITVAMFSVTNHTHVASPLSVDFYASESAITLRGVIADIPDRRALKTNYIVEAKVLKTNTQTLFVTGRVLVAMRIGNRLLEYGDEIVAQGNLELPESDEDFRYDNYLSVKDIYSVMDNPVMERIGENQGNPLLRSIYRFREAMEQQINRILPEPHASLLAGLLVGSRGSMPESLTQDFKTTGLTHIVAISGYNITMLITVMGTLLFWLPLKWRFWPSVLLIAAFTLLTGASASAVRAAVMGILGLLALQMNRLQTTRLTVLWSAFVMLAWNPAQLWYDAGFQLSFLALIGVLEISPLLSPYMQRLPAFLGIRDSLCLTLSAQMLASAWILYLFGQLSLIAPVSNLLAPPAVPYAMLFGTLSVVLGSLWLPLGRVIGMIAWLPLQWITGVANILASLPFASLTLPGLPTLCLAGYFGLLALWVTKRNGAVSSSTSIHPQSPFRTVAAAKTGTHAL